MFYSLRSILRHLLASGPPGITPAFTNAARSCLRQTSYKVNPYVFFSKQTRDSPATPLPHLHDVLTRARSLFGAGMGFSSLSLLASIVRATIGLQWEDEGDMADFLAVIDSDITQAIQVRPFSGFPREHDLMCSQSCREELQAGRIIDIPAARAAKKDLLSALNESLADVSSWGGEFGFERAALSMEYWRF